MMLKKSSIIFGKAECHRCLAVSYTHLDVYKRQIGNIAHTVGFALCTEHFRSFNNGQRLIEPFGFSLTSGNLESPPI